MAVYNPPEILPIFNPESFGLGLTSEGGITESEADSRYVSLTKSQAINGSKTFNDSVICIDPVQITDTTQSTNKSTGCLVLSGGLGVERAIHCDGTIHLTAAGSELQMTGNNSNIIMSGTSAYQSIANTAASTSSTTGALRVAGGAYFGANSLFGGNIGFQNSGFVGTLAMAGLTANRTITIPNSGGIIVLESNSQQLSNKTLATLRVNSNGTAITQIRAGTASTANIIAANWGQQTINITFSPAFPTGVVPKMNATIVNYTGASILNACFVTIGNVSNTGADIYITNAYTSDTTTVATVDYWVWSQ